jgi:hypothetical protein
MKDGELESIKSRVMFSCAGHAYRQAELRGNLGICFQPTVSIETSI